MKPNNDNDNDNDQRRIRSPKLRYPFLKNSYQPMRKKDGYGKLRYYCCWCFKGSNSSLLSSSSIFFSNVTHDNDNNNTNGGLQGLGLGIRKNPILDLDDPLL